MSVLRVFIPAFALETATRFEWLLFADDSLSQIQLLRDGRDELNDLPLADEVELAVSAQSVSFIRATLPAGNRRHVLESLPYLVEDSLMTSPEQAHVVIAEKLDGQDAMLATVDRQALASILQHFAAAGIFPQRVFPVTLLPPLPAFGWAVVCESSREQAEFFLRTGYSAGLALEIDETSPDQQLPASPPLALKLALKQVNANTGNKTEAPDSLYLYSGAMDTGIGALPTDTLANWQTLLAVPCIVNYTPWRHAPSPAMNLLQGDFAPASTGCAWLRQCRPAAIMLVMVLLAQLAGICIDWAAKSHQQNQLDAEMKTLFLTTFPETTAIVDAPLQMQRKHAELQHAAGNADATDFLPLLAALSAQLGQVAMDAKRMGYTAGKLSVQMHAANAEAVQSLAGRLNSAGLHAEMSNVQNTAMGADFQLTVQAGGKP